MRRSTWWMITIAAMLTGATAGSLRAEEPDGKSPAPPRPTATPVPRLAKVLTADTDPYQLDTFQAATSAKPRLFDCRLSRDQRNPGACMVVVEGPFVLTDLGGSGSFTVFSSPPPGGPDRVLYQPRWRLHIGATTATSVHGGRYLVPAGEKLYVTEVSVSDIRDISVSGFRPYEQAIEGATEEKSRD